jgi:hypothetical protein
MCALNLEQVLAWRGKRSVPYREHQPTEGAAEHDAGERPRTKGSMPRADAHTSPQNMSMNQLSFMQQVSTSQLGVIQNM